MSLCGQPGYPGSVLSSTRDLGYRSSQKISYSSKVLAYSRTERILGQEEWARLVKQLALQLRTRWHNHLESLDSSEISIRHSEIARNFACNRSTLSRRHRGVQGSKQEQYGKCRIWTLTRSNTWQNASKKFCEEGLPPTKDMIRNFAADIAKKVGIRKKLAQSIYRTTQTGWSSCPDGRQEWTKRFRQEIRA